MSSTGLQLQPQFLDRRAPPAAQLVSLIDPLATIGALLLCTAVFDVRFQGPYLILALLVFSLTFPGNVSKVTGARTLAREILASWCITVAVLAVIGWATRTAPAFEPRVLLAWLVAAPAARFGAHLALPPLLHRLFSAERAQRVAVIAGACELGRTLAERLRGNPLLGVRVAGFFDDRGPKRTGAGTAATDAILGTLDQLAVYVKEHRVDLIYITLPMASQPRIVRLLDQLHDTTASIYFVPDIFLFDFIQARIDTLDGMPVVSVCETPFRGINGLVKRASDVVLALLILLLLLPLLVAIGIGVRMSSPGPVIFRQRRYGLDGREIVVYKFRSMTVTEDGELIRQATRADGRVTAFGAFLRRYSLDELPQFINVLQGRMSVVGPRPHAVAHTELYRKLIKGYMIRHKVKPGITGLAQVNGFRGETDTLEKMEGRIAYDLAYLRQWSLRLDLWIVLKTPIVALNGRNAY
jgi:putative colanic acid biosysnthesis UDP-glucose lipid carrier transferase